MDLDSPGGAFSSKAARGRWSAELLSAVTSGSELKPDVENGSQPSGGFQTSRYSDKNFVRLKLECITEGQMKAALGLSFAGNVVALAVLLTEFINELTADKHKLKLDHGAPFIYNTIFGAVFLVLILGMLVLWLYRIHLCRCHQQTWQHRRQRAAILALALLLVQSANLIFLIIPNVVGISWMTCGWPKDENSVLGVVCACLRWTCWNTAFLLFCIDAHSHNPIREDTGDVNKPKSCGLFSLCTRPIGTPGLNGLREDALVMDLPLSYHWPKLIIWLLEEAAICAPGYWWVGHTRPQPLAPVSVTECEQVEFRCEVDVPTEITIVVVLFLGAVWFLLWLQLMYSGKRHLNSRPYPQFKLGNLAERSRWVFIVFFVISFTLLWFGGYGSCRSNLFVWLGLLPMQALATIKVLVAAYFVLPLDPRQQLPPLQVELQEFAWTEAEHRQFTKNSEGSLEGNGKHTRFCFETALKALYLSVAVYSKEEATDAGEMRRQAYELLELDEHEVIVEQQHDTRALLGWGKQGIVLAFRGTASFQNFISDVRAWRSIHPTHGKRWRLGQPSVHAGFLRAWQANGLAPDLVQRVVNLARRSLQQQPDRHPLRILITGHSMGGALAQLAAYDLAAVVKEAGCPIRLTCYTYGAPRLGNTPFAAAYEAAVPDTWNVINDQDVVARRGKFLKLYKRAGPRVIINRRGDLIVRPTYAEANVQRIPGGGSVVHHYLGSYRQSLVAVCKAQFSSKRYQDGMRGLLALAQSCHCYARFFQQEMGMDIAEMMRLSRWGHQADRALEARQAAFRMARPQRSFWQTLQDLWQHQSGSNSNPTLAMQDQHKGGERTVGQL